MLRVVWRAATRITIYMQAIIESFYLNTDSIAVLYLRSHLVMGLGTGNTLRLFERT